MSINNAILDWIMSDWTDHDLFVEKFCSAPNRISYNFTGIQLILKDKDPCIYLLVQIPKILRPNRVISGNYFRHISNETLTGIVEGLWKQVTLDKFCPIIHWMNLQLRSPSQIPFILHSVRSINLIPPNMLQVRFRRHSGWQTGLFFAINIIYNTMICLIKKGLQKKTMHAFFNNWGSKV